MPSAQHLRHVPSSKKKCPKVYFFYLPFQVRKGHFPQVIINHPTTISRLRGVSI